MTTSPFNYTLVHGSGTTYQYSGTLSFPTVTFSPPSPLKCKICKKTIEKKYYQLEIHTPKRINKAGNYQWIQNWDDVKYFYFHPICFMKNIHKLKKLIILEEIIDEKE